jgi:hypothetical protein
LTYAYNSCFWLLGVRQLAGNLHEYSCISVKVFIFGLIPDFQKQILTWSCLSFYHSLSQRGISRLPLDGHYEMYIRRIFENMSKNF